MTITRRWRWGLAGGVLVVQGAALAASCTDVGESGCNALASAIQDRCDGGVVDDYITYVANGNCANISAVRDYEQLVDECIPCILDASCYGADTAAAFCSESDSATLPDACDNQLQL